jgi:PBP1b-binding outer membrane lipoprotein LpoB
MRKYLKTVFLLGVSLLILSACAEEAEPYQDVNRTISAPLQKGQIDTH